MYGKKYMGVNRETFLIDKDGIVRKVWPRVNAAEHAQEVLETQDGKKLDIIELPMPKKNMFDGQILPASYANFLISNNTVLVPTFNDPNDRIALDLLTGVFPKHNVVGIYCGDFILGLGTIHCASQQECA